MEIPIHFEFSEILSQGGRGDPISRSSNAIFLQKKNNTPEQRMLSCTNAESTDIKGGQKHKTMKRYRWQKKKHGISWVFFLTFKTPSIFRKPLFFWQKKNARNVGLHFDGGLNPRPHPFRNYFAILTPFGGRGVGGV